MRNYKNFIDSKMLKQSIDPYEFYLSEQNLQKYSHKSGGWAVAGHCPFHNDNNPGSFKVNVETGAFKCWSCGERGGDIIAFLQKRDQLEFSEVIEKLIKEWEVIL